MKKYVILSAGISGMGGGQMYARNKMLYLRSKGWIVDILSPYYNDIIIPELKEFEKNCPIPEYPTYFYNSRKRNKVINALVKCIQDKDYDSIIIEADNLERATWAEVVAAKIGAKHFSFPLGEVYDMKNHGMLDFMWFKYQRRELAGITSQSLPLLFSSYQHIDDSNSYYLNAWCNNVESDVDSPFLHSINKDKYDYIVGCLSRLDKSFVEPAIMDFCRFACKHKEKNFLLLLMGDKSADTAKNLDFEKYKEDIKDNVEFLVTGNLYPVPTRLLEMCDVFFSSAGSSWVCMRSGVPTITFDANDNKPIGVLGRTTQNTLFRGETEPALDFIEMLEQVLICKKFKKVPPSYKDGMPDFQDHMDFVEQSEQEKKYFDVSSIHITHKEWITKILRFFLGDVLYLKLNELRRIIVN